MAAKTEVVHVRVTEEMKQWLEEYVEYIKEITYGSGVEVTLSSVVSDALMHLKETHETQTRLF